MVAPTTILVCLALAASAAAAAPGGSSIAPIVGTWKSGNAVIKVSGTGTYQGTIVSGSVGSSCPEASPPGFAIWKNLSGSGFSYTGSVPFVRTDDCSSVGDGSATFTLQQHQLRHLVSDQPHRRPFVHRLDDPGRDLARRRSGRRQAEGELQEERQAGSLRAAEEGRERSRKAGKSDCQGGQGLQGGQPSDKINKLTKLTTLSAQAGNATGDWLKQHLPTTNAKSKANFDQHFLGKGYKSAKATAGFNAEAQQHRATSGTTLMSR